MSYGVKSPTHQDSLADVLERVLDKGVVIAGDVQINLVGIELLSIKLRLLICTVDKAKELGINWWEADPMLTTESMEREADRRALEDENDALRGRLAILERRIEDMSS